MFDLWLRSAALFEVDKTKADRLAGEAGYVTDIEFVHEIVAMGLDRGFAYLEFVGDLA